MAELVCAECGAANDLDAEFCVSCHAFLRWDEPERARAQSEAVGDRTRAEPLLESRVVPRVQVADGSGTRPRYGPREREPASEEDASEHPFLLTCDQHEVTVPASGEPVMLDVRVTNASTVVDGYKVEAVGAPGWLSVECDQIELLPDTTGALQVRLRSSSATLVPAQILHTVLRVTSMEHAGAHADLAVDLTVPVVDVPVQLRAEPRLLRVRDGETVEFTVLADSGSNRPVQLRFGGSDPELAVRFRFSPPVLELGPGGSGSVRVAATAAAPEPGTEVSRVLTIIAVDGTRSVETLVTLQQLTSALVEDPPVELEAQPSLVRVRDTTVGMVRLVADNRRGRQPARLRLRASDPERAVRVTWAAPRLDVAPGQTGYVDVRLQAPLPEPGSEVRRVVTVTAENGSRTTTTAVTFVQVASTSPMATLAIRTDPGVVRVRDADSATSQVVLDNRRGRTGLRVVLDGTDPERAIRFTFSPPTVDVGPGQAVAVAVRMDAWRPPPGQEVTRPFTISASNGDAAVEASGSLVQAASRAAIETLAVQLDPAVLRLGTRRQGVVGAVVDNRRGAQPVRVALRGDDPENSLRFSFTPGVLDVAPGGLARATVTIRAAAVAGGRETSRPFTVAASDGQSEVVAEGSLVQAAPERRPLARVLFTVIGALAMTVGGFVAFWSGRGETAADVNADVVLRFFADARLAPATRNAVLDRLIGQAAQVGSVALILIALAVLAVFGLTGRTGRLTRLAALLGFVLVVVVFVAFAVGGVNGGLGEAPGPGALLLTAGCVSAYVGGLLVRR